MANGPGTNGKTGTTATASSRVLPPGVEGLLLVGQLRFAAVSARNSKQLAVDIEAKDPQGRPVMHSATGWLADQDGAMTPIGQQAANGELAQALDRACVAVVTARVSKDKLYWSLDALHVLPDVPPEG